jgi:Zinc-binding loop region of homing endonuclease
LGLDSDTKLGGLDSKPKKLLYTEEDLLAISKTKTDVGANGTKALTLMHLCGNKWCLEASHYFVGSKAFNNQVHCHFGLHSAEMLEEYLGVQSLYCKHKPKCGRCHTLGRLTRQGSL